MIGGIPAAAIDSGLIQAEAALAMPRALLICAGAALVALVLAAGSRATDPTVKFRINQPVEIAVVVDPSLYFSTGVVNAVRMALQGESVHGWPFRIDIFAAPCGGDLSDVAANTTTAEHVLSSLDIVAVVGHECSYSFAGMPGVPGTGPCPAPVTPSALELYEDASMPVINGSTTSRCLPVVSRTMYTGTAVPDPAFTVWYDWVQTLPSDQSWRTAYAQQFGTPPSAFADMYYDAARILVKSIEQVATSNGYMLSVDRGAVASAIRHTWGYAGVTCRVDIDAGTGQRKYELRGC